MKRYLHTLLLILFLSFGLSQTSVAQLSMPNVTACPNQVVTVSATWNNVSSTNYSLYAPPTPPPGLPILQQSGSTFTLSNPSQVFANFVYTVVGTGVLAANAVTNTATFSVTIIPPPAMTFTHANNGEYCFGSIATFTAQGGSSTGYSLTAPAPQNFSIPNVITIGPLVATSAGTLGVSAHINGCLVTGVTNIFVSPYKVLSVTSPTNLCQDQGWYDTPQTCPTLTANLPGGSQNYNWSFSGGPLTTPVGSPLQLCKPDISNAGTYTVTTEDVFNSITCPYSTTTQVTVVQTNPVLLSASPSTIVCQGDNLTLIATAGSVSAWSWTGPGFTSNLANPLIAPALPSHSGKYKAKATFQGAFISCSTMDSINIVVVPVAVPVINMVPYVCQGTTNFTFDVTTNAVVNNYSWSGPLFTGTVPLTGSVIAVSGPLLPNVSGTQFVTAHFGNGCSSTSSVQLNVVPVSPVIVYPPPAVCAPDNVFLQALATGASQYFWTGPNGYTAFGPNVWVTYPGPSASGIYTVVAKFGVGTGLVCSNDSVVSVTVSPKMPFSLIPRQEVCYNTPITISGPAGATSYTWTSSTGITSNSKDLILPSAQPKHTGDYTLTVSLGACKTSAESRLEVLTPLDFTLTPLDRTICRGDTLFLEGGATGGSENYAFVWNPAIYLESGNGPKQMAIPLGSVGYNLIVHDIACPNYTISHFFDVKVNQPPEPKLELPAVYGCDPLKMFYNSNTQGEAFVTNYDFGNGFIVQDTSRVGGAGMPITLKTGTYNLKVYSVSKTTGCTGVYDYPSPIVVNPKPGTDIRWEPETPTTNDLLTFYPVHNAKDPITYYTWNFLSGVTPGDTLMNNSPGKSDTSNLVNPTRFYSDYGVYPVVLISQNDKGCIDTVYKFVKIIDEFQIYVPNTFTPNDDGVNDVFMAKGMGVKAEGFTMDIFNRAGQNVFSTKDINEGWTGKIGGQFAKDATYIYKIRAVGMNGEGRKEFTGYVTILK